MTKESMKGKQAELHSLRKICRNRHVEIARQTGIPVEKIHLWVKGFGSLSKEEIQEVQRCI